MGLWVLRAHAAPTPIDAPLEVEVIVDPPSPPPPPPVVAPETGSSGGIDQTLKAITKITSAPAAALIVAKEAPTVAPASTTPTSANGVNEVPPEPTSQGEDREGADCVLQTLERCRAGDGDGCVGVGKYYEVGRGDSFSATKWYVKGCGLKSQAACDANQRVATAMPLGWEHHPVYAPSGDVERPN